MIVSLVFVLTSCCLDPIEDSSFLQNETNQQQNIYQHTNNTMASDDDDATACISGSGDISSSSLTEGTTSNGYDTSLSSSDESPDNGDVDDHRSDNENSENDDPIMEEIDFLRAKTRILQRASHILIQHQEYQNLLSLHECSSSSRTGNDASIWNEAKEFLRYDDDSGHENYTNESSDSSALPKPISVALNVPSHRSNIHTQVSEPHVRSITGSGSDSSEEKIDTSVVQRITSQQYQNRLCYHPQVKPIRYNDWFVVNTMDKSKRKKRNWSTMENSSFSHHQLPTHPLPLMEEPFGALRNTTDSERTRRDNSICRVKGNSTVVPQFSLLGRNSPILTMAMEPYDSAEDGQNSLSSTSRQNTSVVVGTVG